jgi:hypothetical protein
MFDLTCYIGKVSLKYGSEERRWYADVFRVTAGDDGQHCDKMGSFGKDPDMGFATMREAKVHAQRACDGMEQFDSIIWVE